jgi:hypothetical protein
LTFQIIALDSEKSTVTRKICQPNGGNAFSKRKIVRRRGKFFLRWRAIMHAIDSAKYIPKLQKSEAAVGELNTVQPTRFTDSRIFP